MIIDKLVGVLKRYKIETKNFIDIGTRDLEQSKEFHSVYPKAKINAIEANKISYDLLMTYRPKYINAYHFAALDYDGETTFYEVDPYANKGASSVFEATDVIPGVEPVNGMKKVTVPAKRIDTWAKEVGAGIDVAWVDVQGVEIPCLKGFGELLKKVKVIATEAETGQLYFGNKKYNPTQYEELKNYLEEEGFVEVSFDQPWPLEVDVVYIRKELCT